MTDKEKIRAEIERRMNNYDNSGIDTEKYFAAECEDLLKFIDSMQEEPKKCMYSKDNYTDEDRKVLCEGCEEECEFKPTNSVWHDGSETPTDKSKVIVWLGEELNEIVQCHYMYGKFVEKTPTEEYGRHVLVGNEKEGYSRLFVSNKKRADLTEFVVKWAYFEDLIKL